MLLGRGAGSQGSERKGIMIGVGIDGQAVIQHQATISQATQGVGGRGSAGLAELGVRVLLGSPST